MLVAGPSLESLMIIKYVQNSKIMSLTEMKIFVLASPFKRGKLMKGPLAAT